MSLKVGSEDKKKVILASVLGVGVIAALVYMLMFIFGGSSTPAAPPPPAQTATARPGRPAAAAHHTCSERTCRSQNPRCRRKP